MITITDKCPRCGINIKIQHDEPEIAQRLFDKFYRVHVEADHQDTAAMSSEDFAKYVQQAFNPGERTGE